MKPSISKLLAVSVLASAPLAIAVPTGGAVDFDSATPGNMANPPWSESFEIAMDPTQVNLFQVAAGVGAGGSQGVTVDAAAVRENYRIIHETGVSGDVYVLKSSFQMTINEDVPVTGNQGVASVHFSTTKNFWDGRNFSLNLVRRGGGTRYALQGIGNTLAEPEEWRVVGWEDHAELGIPAGLPGAGTTATTGWYTLKLTLEDAGGGLWNVTGDVMNGAGEVVFTHSINGQTISDMAPGDTLYGAVAVPYVDGSDYSLAQGGVTAMAFDDFSVFGYSTSVDADMDGLNEAEEGALGTSDSLADTDGDGVDDDQEVTDGTDPLDPENYLDAPLVVDEGFESHALGNLPGADWSMKWDNTDTTQRNLYKVEAGVGVGGSQGVTIDEAVVKANYHAVHQTGVVGGAYRVQAKFQMTIDENVPSEANHSVAAVLFSNQPEWWNGQNFALTLMRRGGGLNFGITGIGQDAANLETWRSVGNTSHTPLGLPAALPGVGETATSDWFTLRMTMVDAGGGLFDVTADILNEAGTIVFTHTVPGQTAPSMVAGDTLYGGFTVPGAGAAVNPLVDGGVPEMNYDDFRVFQYSTSVDIDMDGLNQLEELQNGTSDARADTDGDGVDDVTEVGDLTDPNDANDFVGAPEGAVVDFNTYATGNLPGADWSEKWDGTDTTQQNLFQVEAGVGADGSQGVSVDETVVKGNYRAVNQAEVIGDVCRVQTKFQMTIDENVPGFPNHAVATVLFSNEPEWWNGQNFALTLMRRGSGLFYGITGIGNDAVEPELWRTVGFEDDASLGLPGALPGVGLTQTSEWFTLRLTMADAGGGLWDVTGDILNEAGQVVFAHTIEDQTAPSMAPGDILYGGFQVPGTGNAGTPITFPLQEGGVSQMSYDDFSALGYSTAEDIDGDNLSQAAELLLGTSDALMDTDGDGHDDDVEVTAGTDPLDPLVYPGSVVVNPAITSISFTDADTIEVQFTGAASTSYDLTSSPDLDTDFAATGTSAATNASGVGTLTYDLPMPVADAGFFRLEEQ